MTALPQDTQPRRMRLVVLLPLLLFAGLAALFYFRLLGPTDHSILPSVLIGHPAPPTSLPPVAGLLRADGQPVPGLTTADLVGQVTVLNVWASWCIPCRDEAPVLMKLAEDKRIRLVGMNYKDSPENARRFLGRFGNPYAASGADLNGRAGIEWGVYGVPENFIIGRDGKISYKLVGPLSDGNLAGVFMPEIEKALAARTTASN